MDYREFKVLVGLYKKNLRTIMTRVQFHMKGMGDLPRVIAEERSVQLQAQTPIRPLKIMDLDFH